MLTCEIVIAAALIAAPKDAVVPDGAWLHAIRPALCAVAVNAELLDPREQAFLLTADVSGDLEMLRTRHETIAPMPHLYECDRFQPRTQINDLLAVNRSYRNSLLERLSIDAIHADVIRDAILETDQLYRVWDTLRDARCDYYYTTVRRQALGLLRESIGQESFYLGRMPPHVPVWHIPLEK